LGVPLLDLVEAYLVLLYLLLVKIPGMVHQGLDTIKREKVEIDNIKGIEMRRC